MVVWILRKEREQHVENDGKAAGCQARIFGEAELNDAMRVRRTCLMYCGRIALIEDNWMGENTVPLFMRNYISRGPQWWVNTFDWVMEVYWQSYGRSSRGLVGVLEVKCSR